MHNLTLFRRSGEEIQRPILERTLGPRDSLDNFADSLVDSA
jgi:hypothetical protein